MRTSEHVGPGPEDVGPAARGRNARWLGLGAILLVCSALVIWSERKTIGTAVIDRKLAAAHVRARYRIVDLGLGRQRLIDVVVGDPAQPDLVADWIELRTRVGLDGAAVTAVSAGGLRLRVSVVGGRPSFGEIDRLLPTSSGKGGIRLPRIDLQVRDARAQITSPAGIVDVSLSGAGRLDGGFRAEIAATSRRLAAAGCVAPSAAFTGRVRTDRGAVTLNGPLRAARISCQEQSVERPAATVDVTLADGLSNWQGDAQVRADRLAVSPLAVQGVRGRIGFVGSAGRTMGEMAVSGGPARFSGYRGRGVAFAGRYRLGGAASFIGTLRVTGAAVPAAALQALRRRDADGTPIAPLIARATDALARAVQDVDLSAEVAAGDKGVTLARLDAASRSGARAELVTADPIRIGGGAISAVAATVRLSGGGLPAATVRLMRSGIDRGLRGLAVIGPYSAGSARLVLDPVHFSWQPDQARVVTAATISGPLFGGRIDGLRLPIAGTWNGGGLSVGPGCATVSFDRLAVATLRLYPARAALCAVGPAPIRVGRSGVAGSVRIPSLQLDGTVGTSPMTLAVGEASVTIADRRIEADRVAASLGSGDAATRLDLAKLTGTVAATGIGGRLEGAAGRIGKVPLLLSGGAGTWSFARGALTLSAGATVADAAPTARFKPVRADAIRLRLAGGALETTATLLAGSRAARVANVRITHDLGRGVGDAALTLPGLTFDDTFQPDALTPLTFGVIADVRGNVTGEADIAWSPAGVTSTGTFRTEGLDLAAAFGPVRGLAGTVRFTDLLQLESAPNQVATVTSINPGVPVEDGRIRYRLRPGAQIAITGGHWPFAGGSLDLQPTTLSFGAPSERRLTFALDGVDAGRFLQQFNFGNLSATGTFDGTLPMIFDANGGRIEGGALRVRRGGGNIAYLGELTKKDLGTWGTVAFQALRSIDYRDLEIVMNGPLAGEMITEVRFAGISQGKGARSNFLIRRLQKLPFVFNIRIRAPFRGLIDSAQSFYDPSRLIERNLPALLKQQTDATASPSTIQPGASEPRP